MSGPWFGSNIQQGSPSLSWMTLLWTRVDDKMDGEDAIDQAANKIFEVNMDVYENDSKEKPIQTQEEYNIVSDMKIVKENGYSLYNIPYLQSTENDKTRRYSYACQGYDNQGSVNTESNTLRKKSLNFINNNKGEDISRNYEVNFWNNNMEQKTFRRVSAAKPPATILEDGQEINSNTKSNSKQQERRKSSQQRRKSSGLYSLFPTKQDLVLGNGGSGSCAGCQAPPSAGPGGVPGVLERRISFGNLVACLTLQQSQQCVRNQRQSRPFHLSNTAPVTPTGNKTTIHLPYAAPTTPAAKKTYSPAVVWAYVLAILGYLARLVDFSLDIITAIIAYNNGNLGEAVLSTAIIILAYLLQCAVAYQIVMEGKFGILCSRKNASMVFIFLPFIIMSYGVYEMLNGRRGHIVESGYVIMFYQIIIQSFPHFCLMLYTICVYYSLGIYISIYEWLSCTSSAMSLAIGLSYTAMFVHENWKIKLLFTCIGGFSAVSRVLICATYGLYHPAMWFLPFLLGLAATFVTWILYKTCSCCTKHHVMKRYACNSLPQAAATMFSWPMNYLFNCFTASGVPVSLIMLILAGVNYTLQVHIGISWLSLAATSVVFLINIVLATVPKFQVLAKKFYEGEEVDDEPYHFTCLGRRSSVVE